MINDVYNGMEDFTMYPHSCTLSFPVKAKSLYTMYKDSLFEIYFGIYSLDINNNYIVHTYVKDINKNAEGSNNTREFSSLNGKEFQNYISAFNIIFEKYNKHVLNFEKRPHLYSEYLSIVRLWKENLDNVL